MKVNFLHIGLHKTASTWLQKVVFDHHPDMFVFQPATREKKSHEVIGRIYQTPTGLFDTEQWWSDFKQETSDLDFAGKIVGISYEVLAGDMIHGRDAMVFARRCHDLFGQTKVILVLRHPVEYINSMYQQYVVQGGAFTMQTLLQDRTIPGADIAHKLDFQVLIDIQHRIWSPENVLVLPFELMRNDRYDFLSRIWEFLGVNEPEKLNANAHIRESVSGVALNTQRILNAAGIPMQQTRGRIRRLDAKLIGKVFPGKYRVGREKIVRWQPRLAETLVTSNYKIWDGDLEHYNYSFEDH
jgi:hypothetical protein